jgi:hypothetical protein
MIGIAKERFLLWPRKKLPWMRALFDQKRWKETVSSKMALQGLQARLANLPG